MENNTYYSATDPDFYYYQADIANTPLTVERGTLGNIPANYTKKLDKMIIRDLSKYKIAVSKFTIPNKALPLMVFPVAPNQNNANVSDHFVTVIQYDFATELYTLVPNLFVTLNYVPQTQIYPKPLPPNTNNLENNTQFDSPYYYIYNAEHFLSIVNTSIKTLVTLLDALVGPPGFDGVPYLYYNNETQLCELNFPLNSSWFDIAPGTSVIYLLAFSTSLSTYLNGYNYTVLKSSLFDNFPIQSIYGLSFANILQYIGGNVIFTESGASYEQTIAGTDYIQFVQSYSSLSSIQSVKSILVCTSTLPIYNTQINLDALQTNNSSYMSFLKILIDIDVSSDESRNSVAQYSFADQYRYHISTSSQPLTEVDLQLYWSDYVGRIHPIFISYGQVATVKLLFEKIV